VGSAATTAVMRSRSRSDSHNPPPAGSLVDASVGAGTSTAPPTAPAAFRGVRARSNTPLPRLAVA
jgi:hypothetical protein